MANLLDFVGDLLLLLGDLGGARVKVGLQPAAHVDHVGGLEALQHFRVAVRGQREGAAHHRQEHRDALGRVGREEE